MSMTFDFVYNGPSADGTANDNFFRIGATANNGNNGDGVYDSYPSFFVTQDTRYILVNIEDAASYATWYELEDYGAISTDHQYHIEIKFDNTTFTLSIEDENGLWTQSHNRSGSNDVGNVVPVWFMSNRFSRTPYPVGNGTFSSIVIRSLIYT